jgi:hypothetical protein
VPISEIDLSAGIVPEQSLAANAPQSLPANFRGFDEDKQPTARHDNKSSDPSVTFDPKTIVGLDDKPMLHASKAQPINFEEINSGVSFSVDLQNTSSADVTIPKTLIIMQATRGTHTLHDSLLTLEGDYFIPAGHTISVTLKNSEFCAAHEDAHQCFDSFFKNDDEIVLFDQAKKFEIHIAIPPIRIPKDQAMYLTGKPETTAGH